jgi:hypothetical protein
MWPRVRRPPSTAGPVVNFSATSFRAGGPVLMTLRAPRRFLVLAGALLTGCFDLDLPNLPPDGGVGPTLTIQVPQPGQTIALNSPVAVEAASVNGVAAVTVTCGATPSTGVFTWNVAPYSGIVDFTRCTLVTSGAGDGGVGQLQLTFIGVDTLGHVSTKSFTVFLDTSTATLSAVLPERVVPRSPLQLTVGSDRPLALPPTVRLAGREADGIQQVPNPDGGAPFYEVTFAQTPGIGIDTYGGDLYNVPFEVLSDVEHGVSLTVDAKATNGNASHIEQNVLLSRVLWDRAVPGRIALLAANPVATPQGIQVGLATVDTNPNANSEWLPGFFRSDDGTYVPFEFSNVRILGPGLSFVTSGPPMQQQAVCIAQALVAQGLPVSDAGLDDAGVCDGGVLDADAGVPFPGDAGYLAVDFDARGHALFARPSQTQRGTDIVAVGEPEPNSVFRPGAAYSVVYTFSKPLTRVEDLLCLPDPTISGNGCQVSSQAVGCFSVADGSTFSASGSSALTLGPPVAGTTAGAHGSQRTYLAPNDEPTRCGQAWTVFGLPTNLFFAQPRVGTAFGGCTEQSVDRLLPVPDGSFVVSLTLSCGSVAFVPGYAVLRIGPDGTILGSYVYKPNTAGPSQPTVLAALADGRVVTMRNDPPYTTFESWLLNDSAPSATARVPGLYVYTASPARLGTDLNAASDGSLSLLLNSAQLGDVVLHFGPALTPRWIYRYPRIANASALIADDAQGTVYYVDPLNNDIVALKRF